MSIALTVYDPITNERLDFVEDRGNGQRLYEDAAGVRVICLPEEVNRYPTAQRAAPKRVVRPYQIW